MLGYLKPLRDRLPLLFLDSSMRSITSTSFESEYNCNRCRWRRIPHICDHRSRLQYFHLFYFFVNHLAHSIKILAYIWIRSTKESDAICLHMFLSILIVFIRSSNIVWFSIDFYRKLQAWTIEIDNVLIDSVLTKKSFSMHLPIFQFRSKHHIRLWHVFTEVMLIFTRLSGQWVKYNEL
jgi:hypothetical protein